MILNELEEEFLKHISNNPNIKLSELYKLVKIDHNKKFYTIKSLKEKGLISVSSLPKTTNGAGAMFKIVNLVK